MKTEVTRRKEEFYCSECRKYFLTYLRTNFNGMFTIQCANAGCKHHHYRIIKDGLVTDQRCNDKKDHLDIIIGLAATLRDTPWHKDPSFLRTQMKIVKG